MGSSPFANRGGAATSEAAPVKETKAPVARAPKDTGVPDAAPVGSSKPLSKSADPFNAQAPSGISGYKPLHFSDQLVLMHVTETGSMATTSSTPERPESEYVRADIIPLTAPEEFTFINGQGQPDTCEPYEPGERLDDILVFNTALVREGQRMLDNGTAWILGRVVKGTAKKGRNAPIIIVEGDDEDQAIYEAWRTEARKAAR